MPEQEIKERTSRTRSKKISGKKGEEERDMRSRRKNGKSRSRRTRG